MRVLVYPELKLVKSIGYSESHLRRRVKAGLFPRPIRLGGNRIAWPEHEIDAHLERCPTEQYSPQSQVAPNQFRIGGTASSFRITLPLVVDGKEHWEGEWQLLLYLLAFGDFAATTLMALPGPSGFGTTLSLPFHGLIHARSNLHLRASIAQSGLTPGSELFLRAVIREYEQPIETHPRVTAAMTRPDRTVEVVPFTESAVGEFDATVVAAQAGVYRFLVEAAGLSGRGEPFTREQLLTAVVGRGAQEPTKPIGTDFCEFVRCVVEGGVFTESLRCRMEACGIDVSKLLHCIRNVCRDTSEGPIVR